EKYIQTLRDTIQKRHGCISRYVQTVAVKCQINGQSDWHGNIEVFDLAGHPKARQCYAWGFKDDAGHWQYVTILKEPTIDSAQKRAVRQDAGRRIHRLLDEHRHVRRVAPEACGAGDVSGTGSLRAGSTISLEHNRIVRSGADADRTTGSNQKLA